MSVRRIREKQSPRPWEVGESRDYWVDPTKKIHLKEKLTLVVLIDPGRVLDVVMRRSTINFPYFRRLYNVWFTPNSSRWESL